MKDVPEPTELETPAAAAATLDFSRLADLEAKIEMPTIPRSLIDRYRGLSRPGSLPALAGKGAVDLAAAFRRRFLQRMSMGWTLVEQQRIDEIGTAAYLDEQLDPESIDDQGLEDALHEALPTLSMTPGEIFLQYREDVAVPLLELLVATSLRSIYSPRQLVERMAVFWTDHFNIFLYALPAAFLKPADDRDVVRRHALGTFPDLLRASAHSPAMLDYLTNNSNVRDHPNENYSRELMELHTLGVGGGYTEQDVKEVARCFTGWTYWGYDAGPSFGSFLFSPRLHDFEAKTVLGQTIPAGRGIEDGEAVIDILAGHPSTARFIATKMLRYMWGYEPPPAAIEDVAQTYLDTGGDIRSMLRSIFVDSGFFKLPAAKIKRPYHLIVSSMRALFAEIRNPLLIVRAAENAGHVPYGWPPPNGYPDDAGYWSGFLLPRWNFASAALTSEDAGVILDLPFLDPSLPAEQLVSILDALLLAGTMDPGTRDAVRVFLDAAPPSPLRLREAIGLVLASPEFQQY
ncbi:MAG: DUF1800 domain-containing protein [Thermoanaerobaculia bacterium]